MSRYSLPEPVLQAMINTLAKLPFTEVGELLGMVRAECQQQDAERAKRQAETIRAETRAQIEAEQAASKPASA